MTIPSKVTSGLPPRLRWYVLAVVAAGLPVVTWAAVTVAGTHLDPRTAFGIAMFFSFALIAELRPVPIDPAGNRNISLAFVFIIASLLLFGWQWAALIGAAGIGIAMAVDQSGQVKVVFNASTYAVAAGLAGAGGALTAWFIHDRGYGGLVVTAILCGAVFVVVNVVLVCIAIGLATRRAGEGDPRRPSPPLRPDLHRHGLRRRPGRHLLDAQQVARPAPERPALRADDVPALACPQPDRRGGGRDRRADLARRTAGPSRRRRRGRSPPSPTAAT